MSYETHSGQSIVTKVVVAGSPTLISLLAESPVHDGPVLGNSATTQRILGDSVIELEGDQ